MVQIKWLNRNRLINLLICLCIFQVQANNCFAQLPTGQPLLTGSLDSLIPYGPDAPKTLVEEVAVTGQPFTKALRINTFNKPGSNNYGLGANIKTALHKGDVLWISFKARSLESKRESSESLFEVRFDQLVNGKYVWPPHLERGVSIGPNWTETSIPFVMKKDAKPEDVRFVIKFDSYAQRWELGPVQFINYGANVNLSDLPKSVIHYEGDSPGAPWRKAAAERINQYRMGDLTVIVTGKNGMPLPGAKVTVQLKKSAYAWGTATNSELLLNTTDTIAKKYRDTLLKYFNKVVFENEIKSKNWARADHEKTKRAVTWLRQHDIEARGHVMVWPGWQNSPQLVAFKNDTAKLRAFILQQIEEETTVMKGQFVEWDVVNEPFANHNVMDSLGGKKVMIDWFKAAKKNAPNVKLFLNEYTMFHVQGNGSDDFYGNIKYLLDNGAPVEGIGEQSHIGGTPPGINFILNKLDKFATFKLPIQISEFDITSDDEDFKSRYIRDYFTAIFSHPSTIGIMQWGFWEGSHWIPAAALWDKEWNIRPSGKVFTELVSKTWSTNTSGTTQKNGEYKVRGFNGKYEITVGYKGKTATQQSVLDSKGGVVKINFNQ